MEKSTKLIISKRVFIVDDNKHVLNLLKRIFDSVGVEVVVAEESVKALEKYIEYTKKGSTFDLIALDIHMPEVDGYELAKNIRLAGYKGQIIAITALASATGRRKCIENGFDYYFGKQHFTKELILPLLSL